MGRFDEITKKWMNASEEEIMAAINERGRGVRCPECGAVAHSLDTVVIFCDKCKLRYELDPYWKNEE